MAVTTFIHLRTPHAGKKWVRGSDYRYRHIKGAVVSAYCNKRIRNQLCVGLKLFRHVVALEPHIVCQKCAAIVEKRFSADDAMEQYEKEQGMAHLQVMAKCGGTP